MTGKTNDGVELTGVESGPAMTALELLQKRNRLQHEGEQAEREAKDFSVQSAEKEAELIDLIGMAGGVIAVPSEGAKDMITILSLREGEHKTIQVEVFPFNPSREQIEANRVKTKQEGETVQEETRKRWRG